MTEPIIAFRQVSKSFGAQQILREIVFDVPPGEFIGLAGVNGAGKTTLIKCLLDFCHLDGGSIALFGLPHRNPRARRQLAFLPERFSPPYYLTGRDFLRYTAKLHGAAYDESQALEASRDLELDARALDRPVRQYSKGMIQKLGIAAVFLWRRQLLVLDEPMSGLDPKARASVKKLLVKARGAGQTVFLTTHTLSDIEELCDRMILLHQGVPFFVGTPTALCQHFDSTDIEDAFLRCIEDGTNGRK
jgi:ABC-2 type transport system ATP-binding protein